MSGKRRSAPQAAAPNAKKPNTGNQSNRAPSFRTTESSRLVEELLESGDIDYNSTGNNVCQAVGDLWQRKKGNQYNKLDKKQLTNAWYNYRKQFIAAANKNKDTKRPASYLDSDDDDDSDYNNLMKTVTPKKNDLVGKQQATVPNLLPARPMAKIFNSFDMEITEALSYRLPSVIRSYIEQNFDQKLLLVAVHMPTGIATNDDYSVKVDRDRIIVKYKGPNVLSKPINLWDEEKFDENARKTRALAFSKEIQRLVEADRESIWFSAYVHLPKPSWDNKIHYNALIKSNSDGGVVLVMEILTECGFEDKGQVKSIVKTVD